MSTLDGSDEGVGVRVLVCHPGGLQEEADDIEAERWCPEAEGVCYKLQRCSKRENSA